MPEKGVIIAASSFVLLIFIIIVSAKGVVYLAPDEQLLLTSRTNRYTKDGPGAVSLNPFHKREKRKGATLDALNYVLVKNTLTGEKRIETGPKLLFVGAFDEMGAVKKKIVLRKNEFVKISDQRTGKVTVIRGEAVYIPSPTETILGAVSAGVSLSKFEYVRVNDQVSGMVRIIRGEALVIPGPYESLGEVTEGIKLTKSQYVVVSDGGVKRLEKGEQVLFLNATEKLESAGVQEAVSLSKYESVRLKDTASGKVRVEIGEQLVFPGPYEVVDAKREGIQLSKMEWVRIVDTTTGQRSIEKGEQVVFLGPTEQVIGADRNDAYAVNPQQAVLVESEETGQKRLVTEPGMFIPGAYEKVVSVQQKVLVSPHEVVIIKDVNGTFTFYGGANETDGVSFFLHPHEQVQVMKWKLGSGTETIEKIDMRAQYLEFDYEVRTTDNVKLRIQGLIFWQVLDVPTMVSATKDPRGDVWNHARNTIIQAISQVTLAEFMEGFNAIVTAAAQNDTKSEFYSDRGVMMHSMEVTAYQCVDTETAEVLQEIIRETTNRINRLQTQESENEIQAAKLEADILLEAKRTELLKLQTENQFLVDNTKMNESIKLERKKSELFEVQADNQKLVSSGEGEAAGLRLSQSALTFLTSLNTSLNATEALSLYRLHQEMESADTTTSNLAGGKASLFVTPEQFNLRLDMTDN